MKLRDYLKGASHFPACGNAIEVFRKLSDIEAAEAAGVPGYLFRGRKSRGFPA